MSLVENIIKNIDNEKIKKYANSAFYSWKKELNANELIVDSKLEMLNQKLCFKSSLVNYPYIETSFSIMNQNVEIGLYRIISLLNGTIEDDYIEIF